MKVSELITVLQKKLEEVGDVEVEIETDFGDAEIETVSADKWANGKTTVCLGIGV